jgi:protein-disulfide isomerase
MKISVRRAVRTLAVASAAAFLAWAPWTAAQAAKDAPPGALAIVDGVPITAADVDAQIAGPLADLRNREYSLRAQALDERIGRLLLEKEAAARKLSVKELEKAEIDDKAEVGEAEAKAYYEANKARFGGRAEAEALKQAEGMLKQQKTRERRTAYLRELRSKAGVKVLLEPLRVAVAEGDAAARGPKEAPVTIVEFSDFQCPYCSRAKPTLDRVREVYGDSVRVVFRDFPLPIHPLAPKAAEAAACARDQGKFWEMHDRLFSQPPRLAVADLKQHAQEIGLDTAAFDKCLDSGQHAADIQKNASDGARYGVSATPAFFVNGRPLVGALPFDGFAQVIDDELERKGLPRPVAKPVPPPAPKPEEK